jgi:hypothetical protein
MYVVALTRWGTGGAPYRTPEPASIEQEALALAPLLGATVYEARLALAAAPPAVLLTTTEVDNARQLLALLRGRGHGAVACDDASVTASERMTTPKSFRFEPAAFVGDDRPAIAYADVAALLLAAHVRQAESTSEHTERKFSLARSALSGGLVNTKKTSVTERSVSQERQQVLYVMNRSGSGHVLLYETRLHYTGLGPALGKSTIENFGTTVKLFREHAPGAYFDDRLLRTRRSGSVRQSGTTTSKTVTTSNDGEVDLAAHLITLAFLQVQL